MIPVTKPYLPSREKLDQYINGIYERQHITNDGPLVQELTARLQEYLGVDNLLLVSNGTLALQVAYRALGMADTQNNQPPNAITTPFTFVATASALQWQGILPRFADIDPNTWCIDPKQLDGALTAGTKGVVATHVFGNPGDIDALERYANDKKIKLVFDASHCFGVINRNRSILRSGDASVLSFHATKLFHTAEGGAIVFRHKKDLESAQEIINFGLNSHKEISQLGINAKLSDLQAALGLCVLDEIDHILMEREKIWNKYQDNIEERFIRQQWRDDIQQNFAYYPILFKDFY